MTDLKPMKEATWESIKKATQELSLAAQKVGSEIYQQKGQAGGSENQEQGGHEGGEG